MLSSYDLSKFSSRLKSIRKTLGYAQLEVSESTGINSDTLRRLENGLSIPRFDTLEVLSQFYKVNLILLLDSYKISSQLSYYYDLIDYYMINNDTESITRTIQNFEENIIINEFNMVD
ncbi:MAG TPA: helix-turn-helix transcriptional regulator, partial [Fusibacter sp.]|nr:helix-turn-helix transcriptional regulator [Fusibacter sp.]